MRLRANPDCWLFPFNHSIKADGRRDVYLFHYFCSNWAVGRQAIDWSKSQLFVVDLTISGIIKPTWLVTSCLIIGKYYLTLVWVKFSKSNVCFIIIKGGNFKLREDVSSFDRILSQDNTGLSTSSDFYSLDPYSYFVGQCTYKVVQCTYLLMLYVSVYILCTS